LEFGAIAIHAANFFAAVAAAHHMVDGALVLDANLPGHGELSKQEKSR
jgi:hypothetical protein